MELLNVGHLVRQIQPVQSQIQMGRILKPGNVDGPDIFSSLYKIIF